MNWAYRALFTLVLIKFALYAFVHPDYLIGHSLSDDAFYYLQIAKQAQQTGIFPTFDGRNLTNGFHLLYELVLIPLVPLFDDSLLQVYAWVITINVIFFIIGLWFLSRVLNQYLPPWLAWVCIAFAGLATLSTKIVAAGLESSLAFMVAMGFLYALFIKHARPWVLGILLGALCLSRLDIGLFYGLTFALTGLWQIKLKKQRVQDYVTTGVAAFAILLPWVIFNYSLFGEIETISSATKQWVSSQLYLESDNLIATWIHAALHYAKGILGNTVGDLVTLPFTLLSGQLPYAGEMGAVWHTLSSNWWKWLAITLPIVLVAVVLGYRGLYPQLRPKPYPPWELAAYLVLVPLAHFLLVTTKLLHLGGLWYWLFIPPAAAYALALLAQQQNLISRLACIALCLIPLTGAITLPLIMARVGAFSSDYHEVHWYSGPQEAAAFLTQLQEPAVVGTFNAGMMGYISPQPVVNLDGLVNNWELLNARKEGSVAQYVQKQGITHIIDFGNPWRFLEATGLSPNQVDLVHQSATTEAFVLKVKPTQRKGSDD